METEDFGYNLDDFLLTEAARIEAKKHFGPVYFALYSSYVSDNFDNRDKATVCEKRRMQNLGVMAVFLALLALVLAAADIALVAPNAKASDVYYTLSKVVPIVAAFAGLLSFTVGYFGAGLGQRKRAWLVSRMCAELVRQWRGRYVLNHVVEILAAANDKEAIAAYLKRYKQDFDGFSADLDKNAGAIFGDIVSGKMNSSMDPWLHSHLARLDQPSPVNDDETLWKTLYDAQRAMRLAGQQKYARHIRQEDGKLRTHPGTQKHVLHTASFAAVISIVFLHLLVTAGILTGVSELKSIYVHLLTVSLALFALALRAIEEGLRPDDHLRRYGEYLTFINILAKRFDTSQSYSTKHQVAWDLEEAAFEEMVEFLQVSHRARYLM